jgi:hypothetical protein
LIKFKGILIIWQSWNEVFTIGRAAKNVEDGKAGISGGPGKKGAG